MSKRTVWFWQRMVTPHMAYLAASLARRGHDVTYVAEEQIGSARATLGWKLPDVTGVNLSFATNAKEAVALVEAAPPDTVHLTQGLRSNGNVAPAQAAIKLRGQRHFVMMETVDQRGAVGLLKPALYSWHLQRWRRGLDGVLAIGAATPAWLRRLAPEDLRIYPFAYFLPEHTEPARTKEPSRFRFLFVGEFISRKRVDLLLYALKELSEHDFEVELLGGGALRDELESLAGNLLPGRVSFPGVVPITEIPDRMANADCLVLPSSHDGWGAVVSESLMAGTPVICSSACGSRAVVEASGTGGVFDTFDSADLRSKLEAALAAGKVSRDQRIALRAWARCLGAEAGAGYLEALLDVATNAVSIPPPPWERAS